MENNTIKEKWLRLKNRFGHRRVIAITSLLIVGLSSLCIHGLFLGGLAHSALLYMLVPYSISLLIAAMLSDTQANTTWKKYLRHMGVALLIFLATSVVLREGFICVLFFFPIYFLNVTLSYMFMGGA